MATTQASSPSSSTPGVDPRKAGPRPPFDEAPQDAPGLEAAMRTKPDFGEDSYVGFGRLMERRVLLTGGDSGIGRAVALAFAREGADVAFTYLPSEREDADETVRVVRAAGQEAIAIEADLADPAACARVVREAARGLGGIDVLVNNAAHQGKAAQRFEELDAERVLRTFRVNVIAMFDLVREALPHKKPGASVINVASVQAYQPSASILDYAATKGAIVTFTKGLAAELIDRGIRVNCVAPGPVWTPLIPQSFGGDQLRRDGADAPMKRPAQPAEIAPAFVFLASDEGRYVNGEILGVTGGELLA
jgi:NAD(P)-dependent dehydrogenase (short-subunit alcohol dehydrogenase family)